MNTHPLYARKPLEELQQFDSGLHSDLALLKKGASHLRRLGWWGLFVIGLVCFPLVAIVAMLGGPESAIVAVFLGCLVVTVITGPYFLLSRYVQRGRRWAIVGAFLLICFMATITCLIILHTAFKRRGAWISMLFETMYLIGHLNLLKLLFRCFAAASRVRQYSLPPITALPADGDSDPDFAWKSA